MLLNKEAYAMRDDTLVYDGIHAVDGTNITVELDGKSAGTIARGQIVDVKDDGTYVIHTERGIPAVIVAESVTYEAGDASVVVQAYTSGTFRAKLILANPELTAADIETLREKSIYLK